MRLSNNAISRSAVHVVWLAGLVGLVAYPRRAIAGGFTGFGGFGAPFSGYAGPFDAASPQWLQAVNSSNSTGLFQIAGYDVSQPYPGKPIDGWTLSVAAIDLNADAQAFYPGYEFDGDSQRVVGYSLAVKAPESLLKPAPDGSRRVNADNSWGMCMWYFEAPAQFNNRSWYNNPSGRPLATNGSCAGFVPDKCISALEEAASTNYEILDEPNTKWYDSRVSCAQFFVPDECAGHLVGNTTMPLPSYNGVPIAYLNGSVTNQDGFDNFTNTTAQDVRDMWDSLVLNYWPTLVVYVPVNASGGNGSNAAADETPPGLSQLLCIAPDGVGTGRSFSYNGTSPNAAGGQGGQNGSASGQGSGTKNVGSPATEQASVLPASLTLTTLSLLFWLCLG